MVAIHVGDDGGIVMFSRDDEGRDFLGLVAERDDELAKRIGDAWWAAPPRPFVLPMESERAVLAAFDSPGRALSASAIRLQKLLQVSRRRGSPRTRS
jgi:hypothetical protein